MECVGRVVVQVCPNQKSPAMLRTTPPVGFGLERKGILGSEVTAKGIEANAGDVTCGRGSPRGLGSSGRCSGGAGLRTVLAGVGGSVGSVGGCCAVGAVGESLFVVLLRRGVGKVSSDQGVGEGV